MDPRRTFFARKDLWLTMSVIGLSFLAGIAGAWTYGQYRVQPENGNLNQSQKVVMQESEVVASVAKKASPSVVSIITSGESAYGRLTAGAGTGIIISKDGYVLTNKHVLPGVNERISIVTADDTMYDNVKIVGADPLNDIAFLKIEGVDDLKPATIGDSSKMAIGQKVIAIGNALGRYETTVTSGIISGKGRPLSATSGDEVEELSNLFQTDAAINPGNSGGPLLNILGEVIGINTAIAEEAEGIGFAIPMNDAKGVMQSVLKHGKVQRAYLGVRYVAITAEVAKEFNLSVKNGAYLGPEQDAIVSGGPAAKAGLKAGDIITKINGVTLNKQYPLSSIISQYSPGETITVTALRDGNERDIKVTLEEYRQ